MATLVDTVGFAGADCSVMLPANDASAMQAEGVDFGATQMLNVPTPAAALGVPITRRVYCPTAPGRASVALCAGADRVVVPTIASPCVTTTLAVLSAAGVWKSVKVTVRSSAAAIVKLS